MKTIMLLLVTVASAITPISAQDLPSPTDNVKRNLFFIEHNITYKINEFTGITEDDTHVIITYKIRLTKSNAEKTERTQDGYTYYFKTTEDIKILIRDANRPVWYALAIVATVASMAIFYAVSKLKDKSRAKSN